MAQRRRPPRQHRDRRNGTHNKAHQQQQQQLPPSPPDEDVDIVPSGQLRGRLSSSVGSPSERGTSESTHTDMTSMHNTDDEEGDDEGTSGMTRAMPMDVDDDDDGRTARHEPASTASLLSPSAAIAARDDDQDEDDDEDLRSIYAHTTTAATHNYPQVATSYRTETPFRVTTGSLAGNSDLAASTRSLWAQDLDYREIHGRLYCREWFMPIDEIEQLRLSLNHQVFLHVLHGEHTTVELDSPEFILDVGTGTGEWAIKMAETFPDCEVVGTDIAAIAETSSVPMNVFFEIEDAEDWDRPPDLYDLVHLRTMEGAFRDWRYIYECAYYSLKPGGWIELQDFDTTESSRRFSSQFSPDSPIHQLFGDIETAAAKSGRRRGTGHMDPHLFMDAGFVDVRVTEYQIPIQVAEKSAGKIWLISCLDSLEAGCLRLLTEQMGWDPERCKEACESAAREMAELAKDPVKSEGLVVKAVVIVARKPLDAPETTWPPPQMKTRSPSPESPAPYMSSMGSASPSEAAPSLAGDATLAPDATHHHAHATPSRSPDIESEA